MNLKQATDAVERMTSRMGDGEFSPEDLAEALANNHRTLQQNVMDFCLLFIDKMDQNHITGRTDLRNEAGAQIAHEIVNAVWQPGGFKPDLPFI